MHFRDTNGENYCRMTYDYRYGSIEKSAAFVSGSSAGPKNSESQLRAERRNPKRKGAAGRAEGTAEGIKKLAALIQSGLSLDDALRKLGQQ